MLANVDLNQFNSIPSTCDYVFNHVNLTLAVSLDLKAFKKINAYHAFGWKSIPSHSCHKFLHFLEAFLQMTQTDSLGKKVYFILLIIVSR